LRLVKTARQVSAGDLSARSGVHSSDEIDVDYFRDEEEAAETAPFDNPRLDLAIDARDPYNGSLGARRQLAMIRAQAATRDVLLSRLRSAATCTTSQIGVRDNVLLKPGKLTDEERHAIETTPASASPSWSRWTFRRR
jgi:hypothetical protein